MSDKKKTLKELGKKYKLSYETIRLIEEKAFKKIKNYCIKNNFEIYLLNKNLKNI